MSALPLECYWEPTKAAHLIALAMRQVGKPYYFGSEGPVNLMLASWDCSELVQHLLACVGVTQVSDDRGSITPIESFDGAWLQWEKSHRIGMEAGLETPGALLFIQDNHQYPAAPHHVGHVAISLGNNYLVEARGKAYGVVIGPVRSSFNLATKVRELYTPALVRVLEA